MKGTIFRRDFLRSSLAGTLGGLLAGRHNMAFNRDLQKNIQSAWSRTFVQSRVESNEVVVNLGYLYLCVLPIPGVMRLINHVWEWKTSGQHQDMVKAMLSSDSKYDDLKKCGIIPLFAEARVPLEKPD